MGNVATFTMKSRPGAFGLKLAAGVISWLNTPDEDFFCTKGFNALVSCWDEYLNRHSYYVEK
jgi:hypothetical protein